MLTTGLLPVVLVLFVAFWYPWRDAILIGGDERFELMKAFLVYEGWGLYDPVWNDQPPLYTAFLAHLFTIFGPTADTARIAAMIFGWLFLWQLSILVTRSQGAVCGNTAVLIAFTSPYFIELCVSCMLELPAISIALLATNVATRNTFRLSKFGLAGAIMGIALQVKLTAGIIVPLLFANSVFSFFRPPFTVHSVVKLAMALLSFAAGMFASYFLVFISFPHMTFAQIIGTHFSSEVQTTGGELSAQSPILGLVDLQPDAIAFCLVALTIGILKQRDLRVPVGFFLITVLVHQVHNPFWYYYYAHFTIPISWLASFGVVEITKSLVFALRNGERRRSFSFVILTTCMLAIYSVQHTGMRLSRISYRAKVAEKISENNLVKELRNLKTDGKPVYIEYPEYAFHSKIAVIPGLAVRSWKRAKAHGFSIQNVIVELEKHKPRYVVLSHREANVKEFKEFIANYIAIFESNYGIGYERIIADSVGPN